MAATASPVAASGGGVNYSEFCDAGLGGLLHRRQHRQLAHRCHAERRSLAVDTSDNVWSWGWDIEGQVGNGVKENVALTRYEALSGQGVTQRSATAQDVVVVS